MNGPHGETLQQSALRDILRQLLNRDAGLDAPYVRLAQHQLVERNVARRAERDLLNGLGHGGSPRRAAGRLSLDLQTRRGAPKALSLWRKRRGLNLDRDCSAGGAA